MDIPILNQLRVTFSFKKIGSVGMNRQFNSPDRDPAIGGKIKGILGDLGNSMGRREEWIFHPYFTYGDIYIIFARKN